MAKKIKFALEMGNGISVRNLDDLKDNFDLAKVIGFIVIGCGLAGFFLSKDEGLVMAMLGFGSGLLGITKAKGD